MDTNPILVVTTRGDWVENRHRGAYALSDPQGRLVASAGITTRPIFPRSAVKSLQALALFTTGAAEKFKFSDEQLALACASHHGEDDHIEDVSRLLTTLGLSVADLECGAHQPTNAGARKALRASGAAPTAICNTCSGKHAGMLADALALGAPTHGYVEIDHPVQLAVRAAMEAALGQPLSIERSGTDGCSIPTWAIPLGGLARGFARMATGDDLPTELAVGAQRLFDAVATHPRLIAGTGHFDTLVVEAFGGRLMHKSGAEGVQCGAIRDLGFGYALKCDDGNMAASEVMVAQLLLDHAKPDPAQRQLLQKFIRQPITNVRGTVVGERRPAKGAEAD